VCIEKDATGIMTIIQNKLLDATEKQAALGQQGHPRCVEFDSMEMMEEEL
jgi:hypothetical protein